MYTPNRFHHSMVCYAYAVVSFDCPSHSRYLTCGAGNITSTPAPSPPPSPPPPPNTVPLALVLPLAIAVPLLLAVALVLCVLWFRRRVRGQLGDIESMSSRKSTATAPTTTALETVESV